METINIRIPSNDFTIMADAQGVVISFPKPAPIHLFEADKTAALKPVESENVHNYVEKTHTDVSAKTQRKHGERRTADGRYRLGGDILSALEVCRQNTRISMSKIKQLISVKTGVKESTLASYFDRGICCSEDVAKAVGDFIGFEIVQGYSMHGEPEWSLSSVIIDKHDEVATATTSTETKDDKIPALSDRIKEATRPRSLSDRATLSEGIRMMINEYLSVKHLTMAILCHELAVRIGVSKTAVQSMLEGETEATAQLIPHIREMIKVDIERMETDGLAVWEGV